MDEAAQCTLTFFSQFQDQDCKTQSKIKKGHSNTYNWVVHVLHIAKL